MKKTKTKSSSLVIIVCILAAAVTALVLVNANKYKDYVVDGPAMVPTLSDGDKVKAKVVPATEVKRGDIIVFNSPTTDSRRVVKRVVGLPGDVITVKEGELIVTKPDKTTYVPYNDNDTTGGNISVTVGANSFYVLGDNRENSLDSRAFGQVPFSSLLGVVKQ